MNPQPDQRRIIAGIVREFEKHKDYADRAMAQITESQLRQPLSEETNSIAVIVKHMAGNLRSRFTDFLTTDGEKTWRRRDTEFVDDFADRSAMLAAWEEGWGCLFGAVGSLSDPDLDRIVTIRGESFTVSHALERSLAHMSYHVGQIVLISRILAERAGTPWRTLTIPRGGSDAFNESQGFTPGEAR